MVPSLADRRGSHIERAEAVHVCGIATSQWAFEHDAVLDELVFDCVAGALAQAGLRKQQVGLVVLASMDVYDGRSISAGLTTPAAGGYLTDCYRIEGDSGQAIVAAAQAIRAGHVDVAVAAAVHHPEIHANTPAGHTAFLDQMSNLAFDPQFNRPVAMTGSAGLALHACKWIEGKHGDIRNLAERAAAEISRGTGRPCAVRNSVLHADDVLDSDVVAWPLTELMMPAHTSGAGAVVLTSAQQARRVRGGRGRLTGAGLATSDWTWQNTWLRAPETASARAADEAFKRAGASHSAPEMDVIELTAPTPAWIDSLSTALGADRVRSDVAICPFGGARVTYPGVANGILRLAETIEWLEHRPSGGRGVVHSMDLVSGPFSQTASVLVAEVG